MTKEAAKNIGLVINLIVVFMIVFIDDYLFKTLDLQYLKFEFKDSFLWNITHKILGDLLPEMLTAGVVVAITLYLIYLSWSCRACTGGLVSKLTGGDS
tara:strand:- start:663 stop:956 length:294 start_codon:yes stop_codon:yes gene_type:complete